MCSLRWPSAKASRDAGRHLGLSPGTISRQIAALEAELRIQLVSRSSRNLCLTDAGRAICEGFQAVIDDVKSVEQVAAELQSVPHGALRVHCRVTFGLHCVVPLLPLFTERYPDIRLDFILSDQDVNLLNDDVEVDIRVGGLPDSTDIVRRIAPSRPILCASPEYLRRRGIPKTPKDLLNHNCLVFRDVRGAETWRFANGSTEEAIRVAGTVKSNSGEALRQLALGGAGIMLLGEWATRSDIASGRLTALMPQYRASTAAADRDIYVVFRDKRNLPIKIRVFIDFLAENLPRTIALAGIERGCGRQCAASGGGVIERSVATQPPTVGAALPQVKGFSTSANRSRRQSIAARAPFSWRMFDSTSSPAIRWARMSASLP